MTSMILTLAATVVALGGVVWSGAARKRHLHYTLIVVMLACLTLAIWRAEAFGATLVFEGLADTMKTLHFIGVALVFACLPLLVFTGVRLARGEGGGRRTVHRQAGYLFVVLVVVTAALGTAMTVLPTPA